MVHSLEPLANPSESFSVGAGTPVGAAMKELGFPNKGPEAVVLSLIHI